MKYLIIILLSFFGLSASAQLMQTNGTAGGYQWVASKSDSLHIIPRGSDTPNIGSTKYGKSTVAAMFYKTTDSTLWIRSSNKWNQVTGTGGGSGSGIVSLGQGYGVIIVNDSTYDVDSSVIINRYQFNYSLDSLSGVINGQFVDSNYYRGGAAVDSFFYSKNGTEYFWYANPAEDRVIYGGIVTWTGTDLDYYVTACYFRKNGIYYLTNDTTVTLPALADADSSRTDVFIVQTLSDTQAQTTTITGTESANPVTPQVDGQTDLYLTAVTLNPNQTTGLNDTLIVYDNLSAGEFEYRSSTGVTTNFSNTTNVYRVPYSVDVSAINNNDIIGFGTETQRNALDYLGLSFFIKLKTVMPNSNGMLVSLWNNGVQVSNEVGIPFNRTNLTYQGFSVPMASFGVRNAYFDSVRFRYAGGGAGISGMYFDFIYFQGNMNPGGPSTGGNTKWVTEGTGITIDSTSTPTVYNISADTSVLATQYYVDSSVSVSSGVQSVSGVSPIDVDNTDPLNPVISYTGDTTRYFVFESPIQADDYGDTVYVYLDSTGNGDYSIAHHSFGYYLGVFLTSEQAANTYITYDSAQGKFMDTAYLSNDTIYGVKNGAPFYIATTGGGGGSVEYVVSGLGTQVDSSGRAYTVNVDTFLISTRAWRDKLGDSLGVIIATKQPTGNYITALTGDVTASGPGSVAATLATVNSNVGTFGSATQVAQVTVNGKGLTTAASNVTITPAATSITGAGDLTKTDDTNVTLTLGGTPTGSLLKSTSITAGWTGTLAATRGGTGTGTTTVGDILVGTGSNTWTKLAHGTTAQRLAWDGSNIVWRDTAAASGGGSADSAIFRKSSSLGSVYTAYVSGTNNVVGTYSTILGQNTSPSVTGSRNVAVGYGAMLALTSGQDNMGIGTNSLQNNQTGSSNVAIGTTASGGSSTALTGTTSIGYQALKANTGNYNTAIGFNAASTSTSSTGIAAFGATALALGGGSNNTAIGQAASYNTTGAGNTSIGFSALYLNTSGMYNTSLGIQSDYTRTAGSYNVAIGAWVQNASTTGSGQLNIGNVLYGTGMYSTASNSSTPTTLGSIGIGLTTPTARLMLPAGTTTASTAPLKFTSGTNMTTPENGAIEYDGTNLFLTVSSTRYLLTKTLTGTAAPATTPVAVGDHFIDTTNKKEYVATGTSSSADWTILN